MAVLANGQLSLCNRAVLLSSALSLYSAPGNMADASVFICGIWHIYWHTCLADAHLATCAYGIYIYGISEVHLLLEYIYVSNMCNHVGSICRVQ